VYALLADAGRAAQPHSAGAAMASEAAESPQAAADGVIEKLQAILTDILGRPVAPEEPFMEVCSALCAWLQCMSRCSP
jgi:hypothetical protein